MPSAASACPGTSHVYAPSGYSYEHHSFEADPSLATRFEVVMLGVGGNTYPPAGTVPVPWIWNKAGLAGSASTVTANPQSLPDQEFAAFLQSSAATGISTFTFPHTLPNAGTWRLSFLAAQRWQLPDPGEVVDHQKVRVTIASTNPGGQVVQEVVFDDTIRDDTYRVHHTRPFVVSSPAITVTFEGTVLEAVEQTALIDLVEVREVRRWSSTGTWVGGAIPTALQDASIPATACVGLDSGQVNTVDVQGELLALEPGQSGGPTGSLSTRRIHVHGIGSLFQVGTEGRPFQGSFQLVLDDVVGVSDATAENVNALLASDGAVVDMHGQKRTSWLRLAQTAPAAAPAGTLSTIVVERMPDGWQVGDQIVIAATDRDFTRAEQMPIAGIVANPNGTASVSLNGSLAYAHCGVKQNVWTPTGTRVLDQRAEVGLLTHNVKVVAIPRTPGPGLHGGHIMIRPSMPSLTNPAFGRFSGVELENMGQVGQSGRYPIHWHMLLGGGKGQFMKGSSIHHSNHRVVAVHGTDAILFEDNVAFEHLGHGVFIEDGSEQFNVFRNNLVMGTRRPPANLAVLPSDIGPLDVFQNRAPATFWITNPHNTFVGNVAGGGEGVGYWFALPSARMGDSVANSDARTYFLARPKPFDDTLIQFDDNSCHSTWIAFDVHDGIHADVGQKGKIKRNDTWRPYTRSLQMLRRFVAYSCNVGIYTGDGDSNLRFDEAVVADTSRAIAMASHDHVTNSLVVFDSGNNLWTGLAPNTDFDPSMSSALLLYDGAARLDQVHLVGYQASGAPAPIQRTAFQGVGAARRRTGVVMNAITCSATLAGPGLVWPFVGWQDFGAPVPVDQDYTALSMLSPSAWGFSIDNQVGSLGRHALATNHPTVVGNHPMMLLQPGTIEFPLPNATVTTPGGLSTDVAWSSPFRFGYLRVLCDSLAGNQSVPSQQFVLRYTREWVAGTTQTLVYEDPWRVQFHKQMGVIADRPGENNGVRYKLLWSYPTLGSIAPPLVELRLSELMVGDAALIGLQGYTSQPAAVRRARQMRERNDDVDSMDWESLTHYGNIGVPTSQPDTGWSWDAATATLWIRFVMSSGGPHPAIVVHHDGLGQVVEVQRQ